MTNSTVAPGSFQTPLSFAAVSRKLIGARCEVGIKGLSARPGIDPGPDHALRSGSGRATRGFEAQHGEIDLDVRCPHAAV